MIKPISESDNQAAAEPTHPSLRVVCETRKAELEEALGQLAADGSPKTRHDIEAALHALDELLTGKSEPMPSVVAEQLSRWLETSKYLGAKEARDHAAPAATPKEDPPCP